MKPKNTLASRDGKPSDTFHPPGVVGTSLQSSLDRIACLAAGFFRARCAVITLLYDDRHRVASRCGQETTEAWWERPFCEQAMQSADGILVLDASKDQRFASASAVTGRPGVRFCAGVPWKTRSGSAMGTLCVFDTAPRDRLEENERTALEHFAGLLSENWRAAVQREQLEEQVRALDAEFCRVTSSISQNLWSAEIDEAGSFSHTYISPTAESITGRPAEFFLGDPDRWLGVVHPEDRPYMQAQFTKLLSEECHGGEVEYRILHTDGSTRYLRSSVVVTPAGGRRRVNGVVTDITEQKRMEEELRKLSRAVEQSPAAIVITDLQGRIEYVNPKFSQLTGYTREEVIGTTPRILESGETSSEEFLKRWETIRTGEWLGEFQNRTKDGQPYWESVAICPIRDPAGIPTHYLTVRQDITQRKKMEEALRLAEERFRIAAERASDIIVDLDILADHAQYFGRFEQLLGLDPQRLPRSMEEWMSRIHPDDRKRIEESVARHFNTREPFSEEYRVYGQHGERYLAHRGTALWNAEGKPYRFIGVGTDITERKHAEIERSRLAAIVESANDAIISTTLDGTILTWNSGSENLYGYSVDEVLGRSICILSAPGCESEVTAGIEKVRNGEAITGLETLKIRKDGTAVPVAVSVSPIRDSTGTIVGISGIHRDMTETRRHEKELEDSRQQLRNLAARMEALREEERTRTAREVHDELGQVLMVLRMEVVSLARTSRGPRLLDRLRLLDKLIGDTINSVHRICAELRPSLLDHMGLEAALEWQLEDFQFRTQIQTEFHPDRSSLRLTREETTAVFRIVQELLTNVVKHSGATRVTVSWEQSAQTFVLTFTDNGQGLARNDATGPRSLGILGMRERATLLGGTIDFRGLRGKGTSVVLKLPLSAPPASS